ncbi:Zinc finger, RAN-binding domain containing 2 [Perkinsus olseni]|uniref:Zinc finger, RAN-binding domain containing 2 n=1 Tax=Perkinsus olseni TaxID=32597 RepID=A0A7J6S4X0_PEROL|nr:Zinc finger, RAN-binding domain containing 2 [Perkinsus olseni]KAF4727989.1 Zinc finger, RAN-binding domain containing 2 [Perkinsus olseni]
MHDQILQPKPRQWLFTQTQGRDEKQLPLRQRLAFLEYTADVEFTPSTGPSGERRRRHVQETTNPPFAAQMAPYAAIGLGIGFAFLFARENLEVVANQLEHPFALQIYTYVTRKLVAFSNATIEGADVASRPAVAEDLYKFQRDLIHLFSLMSALAMRTLADPHNETAGAGLTKIFRFIKPGAEMPTTEVKSLKKSENRKPEVQRLRNSVKSVAQAFSPDGIITKVFGEEQKFFEFLSLTAQLLQVIGRLSKWEEGHLNGQDDVLVVSQWIVELMLSQNLHGRLNVHGAIQSRVYQEISNGMLGYNQALKISKIPFPFPFAQIIALMSFGFLIISPIAMITTTNYWHDGLNQISIELEEPYGTDANDLPMKEMQFTFVHSLEEQLRSSAPIRSREPRKRSELAQSVDLEYCEDFAEQEKVKMDSMPNRRAVLSVNVFLASRRFVAPCEAFPEWFMDDDLEHFNLGDFRYKFRMHTFKDLPIIA